MPRVLNHPLRVRVVGDAAFESGEEGNGNKDGDDEDEESDVPHDEPGEGEPASFTFSATVFDVAEGEVSADDGDERNDATAEDQVEDAGDKGDECLGGPLSRGWWVAKRQL